jgi:hypothetical protein
MKFWEYALEASVTKANLPGLLWALRNGDNGLADRFDDIAKNLRRYIGIVGDSYTPDNREETASLVESEGVASILRDQPNKYEPGELVEPYKELDDNSRHYLALDIDHPTLAIESSTSGHYHLYIKKPIRWDDYVAIMEAMAEAGLVEEGYVAAAKRRGWTCLRTPWTKKGFDRWGGVDKQPPSIKDGRLPRAPWRTNPHINDPREVAEIKPKPIKFELEGDVKPAEPVRLDGRGACVRKNPITKAAEGVAKSLQLSDDALKVIEDAKREFKAFGE